MAKGNPHLGLVPLKHIPFGLERQHRRLRGHGSGISCGRINTGVWQWRTKSRVTVKTKWELVWYILVRNLSTGSMVMSGRHLSNLGPRSFAWYPAWMIADSRSMDRSRSWWHRDPLTALGTMGRTGSHNQGSGQPVIK